MREGYDLKESICEGMKSISEKINWTYTENVNRFGFVRCSLVVET